MEHVIFRREQRVRSARFPPRPIYQKSVETEHISLRALSCWGAKIIALGHKNLPSFHQSLFMKSNLKQQKGLRRGRSMQLADPPTRIFSQNIQKV
ncbi:MAG: hypothetical protein KDA42_14900 [Planctomycetales bacterium]|nr:hypothetical protein [Planctomycetales bacterium]